MLDTYKLIHGDSVLVAQPILIKHYGRVGALLIQQIHYWSQKGQGIVHNNQRWIYNTSEQWAEQLCVSASTIKRAVQKLIRDGIIHVQKLSKHKSNQTNSYTLNHERLMALVGNKDMRNQKHKKECVYEKMDNTYGSLTKGHRVKMSLPSDQNDPMIIQRLTNKNKDNKSEDYVHQHIQTRVEEGQGGKSTPSNLDESLQVKEIATPSTKASNEDNTSSRGVKRRDDLLEANKERGLLRDTRNDEAGGDVVCDEGVEKAVVKTTTVQDMVDIWNEEVTLNKKTMNIRLNREISKYLMSSYRYKFNEDLLAWTHYCRLIASSPYLMGSDFTLSLTWALRFSTIDRIMEGELGVKGLRPVHASSKTEAEGRAEALRHIEGVRESQGCKAARHAILKALGPVQYNAWFTQVDITDNGATLKPHNRFVDDAIRARFGDVLERVRR